MSDAAKDRMKSVVFALALCIMCSLLLTLASSGLKKRQDKNILADKRKNILIAAGLLGDKSYSYEEIASVYTDNIKSFWVDSDGHILSESFCMTLQMDQRCVNTRMCSCVKTIKATREESSMVIPNHCTMTSGLET